MFWTCLKFLFQACFNDMQNTYVQKNLNLRLRILKKKTKSRLWNAIKKFKNFF